MNLLRIKTIGQINARTQDGREFSATDGSVAEIDGEDAGMVGLAKSLIMSGQAEHYGDVGAVADQEPVGAEDDVEAEDEANDTDEDGGDGDGDAEDDKR